MQEVVTCAALTAIKVPVWWTPGIWLLVLAVKLVSERI